MWTSTTNSAAQQIDARSAALAVDVLQDAPEEKLKQFLQQPRAFLIHAPREAQTAAVADINLHLFCDFLHSVSTPSVVSTPLASTWGTVSERVEKVRIGAIRRD